MFVWGLLGAVSGEVVYQLFYEHILLIFAKNAPEPEQGSCRLRTGNFVYSTKMWLLEAVASELATLFYLRGHTCIYNFIVVYVL